MSQGRVSYKGCLANHARLSLVGRNRTACGIDALQATHAECKLHQKCFQVYGPSPLMSALVQSPYRLDSFLLLLSVLSGLAEIPDWL